MNKTTKASKLVAPIAAVPFLLNFGEEKATVQERIQQDIVSDNKYFFLRLASEYYISLIEQKIVAEETAKGTHITMSPKWQPTIEDAKSYLAKQASEKSAFSKVMTLLQPVEDSAKFAQAWIDEQIEDKYQTRCMKACIEIGSKTLFAYVTASVFITGAKKITSPQAILITERDFNAHSAIKKIAEIQLERAEYANESNKLSSI